MAKLTPHLSESEVACRHCGKVKFNWHVGMAFEVLRYACGNKPIGRVTGYRCPTHNKNVDGATNSYHMKGAALDLGPPSGMSLNEFHAIAKKLQAIHIVGGLGLYPPKAGRLRGWIHIDVGPRRNWTK